jgi:hypothetical protein
MSPAPALLQAGALLLTAVAALFLLRQPLAACLLIAAAIARLCLCAQQRPGSGEP